MGLKEITIGVFVFSFVVLTAMALMDDMNTNYSDVNVNMTSAMNMFDDDYNLEDEVGNDSNSYYKKIFSDSDVDSSDTESSLFAGGFKTLSLVKNSVSMIGNIMSSVANELGLPEYVFKFASGILFIIITFGIIFLIFRLKA
jgi:hypothetical protein